MDNSDYDRKLDELDRMLNDPDSKMEPEKVWNLLAELSNHDATTMPASAAIP
jgi:hypothetical protein